MTIETFKAIYSRFPDQDPSHESVEKVLRFVPEEELKAPIHERIRFLTKDLIKVDDETEFWAAAEKCALRNCYSKTTDLFLMELEIGLMATGNSLEELRNSYLHQMKVIEEGIPKPFDYFCGAIHTLPDSTLIEFTQYQKRGEGRCVMAFECETMKDTVRKGARSVFELGRVILRVKKDLSFICDYHALNAFRNRLTKEETPFFLSYFSPLMPEDEGAIIQNPYVVYDTSPINAYHLLNEDMLGLSREEQKQLIVGLFCKVARLCELNIYPAYGFMLMYKREGGKVEPFFKAQFLETASRATVFFNLASSLEKYFTLSNRDTRSRDVLEKAGCPAEGIDLMMAAFEEKPLSLPPLPEKVLLPPHTVFSGTFAERYEGILRDCKIPQEHKEEVACQLLKGLSILLKYGYFLCDMGPYNILYRKEGEGVKAIINDYEGLFEIDLLNKNPTPQLLKSFKEAFELWGFNRWIVPDYIIEEHGKILSLINEAHLVELSEALKAFQTLIMGWILLRMVTDGEFDKLEERVSSPIARLILQMIDKDPTKRPKSYINVLVDPAKRPTVEEIRLSVCTPSPEGNPSDPLI